MKHLRLFLALLLATPFLPGQAMAYTGQDLHLKNRGQGNKVCLQVNDAGTQTDYVCANPTTHGVDVNGRTDGATGSSGKVGEVVTIDASETDNPTTSSGYTNASASVPAGTYLATCSFAVINASTSTVGYFASALTSTSTYTPGTAVNGSFVPSQCSVDGLNAGNSSHLQCSYSGLVAASSATTYYIRSIVSYTGSIGTRGQCKLLRVM